MTRSGAHFTEEQYRYARDQASALEYATRCGYPVIKNGNCYRMRDHDSMVFTLDGRWFWNSRGLRGRAIEFAVHYERKTLPEAVLAICGTGGQWRSGAKTVHPIAAPSEKKPFALPPKAKSCRRLYAYLCGTRKLDRGIITGLVRAGDLYESVRPYTIKATGKTGEAHNAVFVGRSPDGEPRSAFQRGLSSFGGGSAFKRDVAGSDPAAPFCVKGRDNVTVVFVFEAAIDAISHATIYKYAGLDYRDCDRIALGGTEKGVGLLAYLKAHAKIKDIWLAFDEDSAGQIAAERIEALLHGKGYNVHRAHQKGGKDWNDYLRLWLDVLEKTGRRLPRGVVGDAVGDVVQGYQPPNDEVVDAAIAMVNQSEASEEDADLDL